MNARRKTWERLRGISGTTLGTALGYALATGVLVVCSDAAIYGFASQSAWFGYWLALKGLAVALAAGAVVALFLRRETFRQAVIQKELYLAQHDPSTNLFRRPEWIRRVDSLLSKECALHEPAVVLTVIVDRYDYLVHRFGFEHLNQLLSVFGRRLRVLVRGNDLVGCVSPAVFVIYMHGIGTRKQAMEIVERILETGKRTFLVREEPVTLNLNIGLCSYPEDGANAEDLLARANIAMRRAVLDGQNCYCWYTQEMADEVVTRVTLEKDLEKALDRQELQLYFQPRVALNDERICGCEALLRWKHPRRGLIPPATFIDVAEDSGLIVEIGKWVLAQSLVFLKEWAATGLPAMSVSVNVSHTQLTKGDFNQDISAILDGSQAYAPLIELELTESVAMSDPQLTMQVLRQVKEVGMRVALDDFGTGYSSLSYLQRLPIDCLKIDRSFIVDLIENRNSQELIRTVIGLGHSLGTRVLAEGVETLAQVRMLAEYGCDEAQGYYYGHPVPADEILSQASARYSKLRRIRDLHKPYPLIDRDVGAKGAVHARS
ncbi:MAG: putative bifunctional diguanylate cyclase/phosphodiesterase [Bacillota bacterium]